MLCFRVPCYGTHVSSAACHRESLRLILRWSMLYLLCRKWQWDGLISLREFLLSVVSIIPLSLHTVFHLGTILIRRTSGRRLGNFKQSNAVSDIGQHGIGSTFTLLQPTERLKNLIACRLLLCLYATHMCRRSCRIRTANGSHVPSHMCSK
jgi:hypothetical protein